MEVTATCHSLSAPHTDLLICRHSGSLDDEHSRALLQRYLLEVCARLLRDAARSSDGLLAAHDQPQTLGALVELAPLLARLFRLEASSSSSSAEPTRGAGEGEGEGEEKPKKRKKGKAGAEGEEKKSADPAKALPCLAMGCFAQAVKATIRLGQERPERKLLLLLQGVSRVLESTAGAATQQEGGAAAAGAFTERGSLWKCAADINTFVKLQIRMKHYKEATSLLGTAHCLSEQMGRAEQAQQYKWVHAACCHCSLMSTTCHTPPQQPLTV